MNNHRKFEELLQGYLDNNLNSQETEDFKIHLKSCKKCEENLNTRKKLLEELRSTKEEIQCPDYLIDNILQNTTKKNVIPIISSKIIRWKYLVVGAVAMFIVVSTVLINTMDNQNLLTTKNIIKQEKKKPLLKEIENTKEEKRSAEKEKAVGEKGGNPVEKVSKPLIAPSFSAPEPKTDVAKSKEQKDILSSTDMIAKKETEAIQTETPLPQNAPKPSSLRETSKEQSEETKIHVAFSRAAKEEESQITSEYDAEIVGIPGYSFEETRFVFPEEGSVVGEDFDIVLILENPTEKIEINLDGEQITNYKKTGDSNIIFIGSDSLPPLEEGLHFLSIVTTKEKNITFYKEG
jgi:hypothetical protein